MATRSPQGRPEFFTAAATAALYQFEYGAVLRSCFRRQASILLVRSTRLLQARAPRRRR